MIFHVLLLHMGGLSPRAPKLGCVWVICEAISTAAYGANTGKLSGGRGGPMALVPPFLPTAGVASTRKSKTTWFPCAPLTSQLL